MTQINGQSFPDHVLALTWDDGPDRGSLALAQYLRRQRVAATFFVVSEWARDLSSDPGEGTGVYETGHAYLRVLAELTALGHRLGNHTLNHRLLTEIDPAAADAQVRENQRLIDPFLTNELRLFRAPGGAWSAAPATAIAGDPYLAGLVGPIRWDVDRKDWESSLACNSDRPESECDDAGVSSHKQTKPLVTAARYLQSIEDAKRGIVLLHDRVGHVGSGYAIEVARALIPELKSRGYVFVAPVLGFSPLARRAPPTPGDAGSDERSVGIADVDGDGRADRCARDGAGVVCAPSIELAGSGTDLVPRAVFQATSRWDLSFGGVAWGAPERARSIQLADVDGDRRADLCGMGRDGIVCALATSPRAFARVRSWAGGSGDPVATTVQGGARLLFGDVDGDGKTDACARSAGGIVCARSTGATFAAGRSWLAEMTDASGWGAPSYAESFALADVDGDGRADVCGRGRDGITCALSRRTSFAHAELWSSGGDFGDGDSVSWANATAHGGSLEFADLNGDGRADVCGRGPTGIVCSLSTGRSFTKASGWLRAGMTDADGWTDPPSGRAPTFALADINGDGRADLCVDSTAGVACGIAP